MFVSRGGNKYYKIPMRNFMLRAYKYVNLKSCIFEKRKSWVLKVNKL